MKNKEENSNPFLTIVHSLLFAVLALRINSILYPLYFNTYILKESYWQHTQIYNQFFFDFKVTDRYNQSDFQDSFTTYYGSTLVKDDCYRIDAQFAEFNSQIEKEGKLIEGRLPQIDDEVLVTPCLKLNHPYFKDKIIGEKITFSSPDDSMYVSKGKIFTIVGVYDFGINYKKYFDDFGNSYRYLALSRLDQSVFVSKNRIQELFHYKSQYRTVKIRSVFQFKKICMNKRVSIEDRQLIRSPFYFDNRPITYPCILLAVLLLILEFILHYNSFHFIFKWKQQLYIGGRILSFNLLTILTIDIVFKFQFHSHYFLINPFCFILIFAVLLFIGGLTSYYASKSYQKWNPSKSMPQEIKVHYR